MILIVHGAVNSLQPIMHGKRIFRLHKPYFATTKKIYKPSNQKLVQIKKEKDHYNVKSESSNRWYEVYPDRPFCTCPNFVFRTVRGGGVCKHIAAVQAQDTGSDKELIEHVRSKGEIESLELIKEYGEPKINSLLQKGELVEKAGKIRVLE